MRSINRRRGGRHGLMIRRLGTAWMLAALCAGLLAQASPSWMANAAAVNGPGTPTSQVSVNPTAPTVAATDAAPVDLTGGDGGNGASDANTRDVPVRVTPKVTLPPAVPTEIVAKRTEFSRTIALPDGKFRLETTTGRMNYQDATGAWQPIDLALKPAAGKYGLSVAALDRKVDFGTGRGTDAVAQIAVDGVGSLALSAPGHGLAQLRDRSLTYPADDNGPALLVQPTDRGFEFQGSWANAKQDNVLDLVLTASGVTPVIGPDGRTVVLLRFVDKGDFVDTVVAGEISAPRLYEGGANGLPVDDASVVSVALVSAPGPSWTLRYTINTSWLSAPAREFPVVLDPTTCIGAYSSLCEFQFSGSFFDQFIIDRTDIWPTPLSWNVTRVGFDDRHVGGYWYNAMRAMVYFPTATLPDGAVPYDCQLALHIDSMYSSPAGRTIYALPITEPWAYDTRWFEFGPYGNGDGYTWTNAASAVVPSGGGSMYWWPQTWCQHAYTQNPTDWIQNYGFAFKMDTEASGSGEVEFDRAFDTDSTVRPSFQITYSVPSTTMGFDPALGANYSPSTMLAGQTTTLPVVVTNKSSIPLYRYADNPPDHYVFGYRWFDQDNQIVSSSTINLPVSLNPGDSTGSFPLAVTPPSTPGVYSLRLDMVHDQWGVLDWASDFADSSKYFERRAYSASPQNTRWVGSSAIERDEFSIEVVATTPGGGEWRSVTLGDGGTLAINLWSKDLTYTGDEGVGFNDLLTVGLSYNYHATATSDATGVLGANGWSTNFDEKITADTTKVGTYTYQDPSGNRSTLSTNPDGQITGAGVSINRPRLTLLDETGSTPNGTFQIPSFSTNKTFSGTYAFGVSAASSLNVKPSGFAGADLNAYPTLSMAVRTDGATSMALALKVKNLTDSSRNGDGTGVWFAYTFGTDFSTGYTQWNVSGSIASGWVWGWRNLPGDLVAASAAGVTDQLQLVDLQTITGGGTGTVFFDAVHLEAARYTGFDDTQPSWTSGSAALNTTDVTDGTASLQVLPTDSPDCGSACLTLDLAKAAYLSWSWKKVGGGSASLVVHVNNANIPDSQDITYYAGTMPAGAAHPIQVAPTAPDGWVKVTRDLVADARTVLNWFGHSTAASTAVVALAGTTRSGLHGPDAVYAIGFAPRAVDGTKLLLDGMFFTSLPDHGGTTYQHPSSAGDSTPTYEYSAAYPDGTIHYFNAAGLLMGIADRNDRFGGTNENRVKVLYTVAAPNVAGQAAFKLDRIAAPTDGVFVSSGVYWQRELVVTTASGTVTFTESLGTKSSPTGTSGTITGRSTTFTIASGDVTRIKPARQPSCGTRSGAGGSGCIDITYNTTTHQIATIVDPRSTGSDNYSYGVTWTSNAPTAITDNSTGGKLLTVLSWNVGGSLGPASARVEWQDAAAARVTAGAAIYTDLTSSGQLLYEYATLPCVAANCLAGNAPSVSNLANQIREAHEFDGVNRVSSVITYRCAGDASLVDGCTGYGAERIVTRRGQKASSMVDNFVDALTGGEVAWTQTADEYAASMRASAGGNPDLYRTSYIYDEFGRQTTVTAYATNANPDYANVVKTSAASAPAGYWRLGEASGNFADSSGNGKTATAVSIGSGYAQPGALQLSASKAATFNGTSSEATVNLTLNQTAYTLAGWAKLAGNPAVNGSTIIGNWTGATGGAVLYVGNSGHWALYNNGPVADSGITPVVGRWYYVVGTWDGSTARIYVDGTLLSSVASTGAPAGATGLEIGAYANGYPTTFFNGTLDEVAVWNNAISASAVQAQYLAGLAAVTTTSHTAFDAAWRPTQRDDQYLSSPGFEAGAGDWDLSGDGLCTACSPHTGSLAYATGTTASTAAVQRVNLVAGQTFRFQVWSKGTTAAAQAKVQVDYWQPGKAGGANWTNLVDNTATGTSWASRAWDITLPLDSDGRVRITLTHGPNTASVIYDDAAVLTSWANATYNANGTPLSSQVLKPAAAGSATAVIEIRNAYAADTAASPAVTAHPAIWPTSSTANYVSPGTYNPATPDQNVISSMTYDAWGRTLATTDPDGVTSTNVYSTASTTANGYLTDILSVSDGLGNATSWSYDLVGHVLTQSTPTGATTNTAYNLAGAATLVTAPDGTKAWATYDAWGFKILDIANYTNAGAYPPTDFTLNRNVVTRYTYDRHGNLSQVDTDCAALSGTCTGSGYVAAQTLTSHDLAHNAIAVTTSPTSGGGGTTRTTTSYFDTYTVAGGPTISRPKPSAVRTPIVPTGSPAPACPDTTITLTYCTTAAVMTSPAGTTISSLDIRGQAMGLRDANGISSRTFLDLAGRPVFSIANYSDGAYSAATPDQDLITTTQYDLAGQVAKVVDTLGRAQITSRDSLERATAVTSKDSAGADVSVTKTVYTPGGRVDRVSAPDGTGVADTSRTWTKTVYDKAGRAVKTLDHFDTTGAAGMVVDSFEGPSTSDVTIANDGITERWDGAAGVFTTGTATLTENRGAAYQATILADSPLGFWRLGEPSGTTADNSQGTASRDGTYAGTYTLDAPGATVDGDGSINLGAATGVITVPDAAEWDFTTGPVTVEAWVKSNGTHGTWGDWVLGKGTGGPLGLYFRNDGKLELMSSDVGTIVVSTNNLLVDQNWHHVVAVYHKDVQATLYWDGSAVSTGSITYRTLGTNAQSLAIGSKWPSPITDAFHGSIDEVAVYGQALSAAQILAHYNAATSVGVASAKSGVSVLDVATSVDRSGAEWKLDGTFKSGRTYKATIWTKATAGKSVTIKIGTSTNSANTVLTATGDWQRGTVTWTPSANRTGVVLAVYRSTSTGPGYTISLDDAVVWDSASPDLDVPTSETVNDADGAIIRTILPPGDPGTDEPLVTTTTRDALGRPTTVTVNAIAGAGTGDTTSNLASTTHYDALGRSVDTVDQAGIKTSFAFDRLGRAIQTIQNDTGSAPANAKADNDVKSTFAYDALGELVAYCPAMQVILFVAGTPCSPTATSGEAYQRGWHWTYDTAGHQVSEIPPVNQTSTALDTTVWTYNTAGQLTRQTSQSAGGTSHRYTLLTYDNAGRVTQSVVYQGTYPSGTAKIDTRSSYFGDGAQDTIAVYLNGSGSASDAMNFTYDSAGRPDQVKRSSTVLTDFAWNADGTLASRADGDAGAVGTTSFTYDWAKRISGATLPSGWQSGGGTASFTYRPDGLLATRKFNSDTNAVTYAYDAAKRPTSLSKTLTGGSLTLTQAWDRTGNITSEGRTITPAGPTGDAATNTQAFTYDDLNRLIGSSGLTAGARSYEWDLNSNRVSKTEAGVLYEASYDRTDALVSVKLAGTTVVSGYDTYGNLTTNPETGTTAGIVTLAYDLADRTTSITTGGTTTTLALDALGRVRTRTTGSSVDTYSYAGPTNNVVRIANAGGSGTTTDSVLDPSGLRFGTKTGATVAWLLADLHGSVAVGLNQAGTSVTDALRYDGAGMTVATWPGGGSAATASWKYQGRLDVAASGPALYDFEAREMSPGLGSFTSNDTVLGSATNPRQLNRYVYAGANATTFTDPDGHCWQALALPGGGEALFAGCVVYLAVSALLLAYTLPKAVQAISLAYEHRETIPAEGPISEAYSHQDDLPKLGVGPRPYIPKKGGPPFVRDKQTDSFVDKWGNRWKWADSREQHGGPHWDVTHPDGSYTNVGPDGNVIGDDNFPNQPSAVDPPAESSTDPSSRFSKVRAD